MRKISTLTTIALCLTLSSFAKIWRVNNNQGITANFTTLQAAHDGAASGDTIYLESSPTSYGGATFTKKLAVIGTGYFLDQNPDLQAFVVPSKVDGITLNAGSAGTSLEGLSFNANGITINVSNVVIRKNHFGSFNGATPDNFTGTVAINNSASNIFITQNFGLIITNNSTSTGLLISNNVIAYGAAYGDGTGNPCLALNANSVAIITHNIFRRGSVSVSNSNLSNNIMYVGSLSGSGNLMSNNIGNGTQFGSANGNQQNVAMTSVFVASGSADGFYKLKTGSPAIGAGYGSTTQNPIDAGIFSGSTPYALSGIPAIPSIYYFNNQPVGSNSDPIDVQIKVRSNN